MSNGKCQEHCQGSAFAIVQGKQCWCSDLAPPSDAESSDCNQKCPGYPFEKCGGSGSYGYLKIGTPSGTAGASGSKETGSSGGSGSNGGSDSSGSGSSDDSDSGAGAVGGSGKAGADSKPATVVQTDYQTQVQTQFATETNVQTKTNTVSQDASTVLTVSTEPPTTATEEPTTKATTKARTKTPKPDIVTSAHRVTVDGAVITQMRTATAVATATTTPGSSAYETNQIPHQTSTGLSKGAVAGITIAAIAAVAILAFFLFLLWRRRQFKRNAGTEGGLNRTTSVLSKVGLLSSAENHNESSQPTGGRGPNLPRIHTIGLSFGAAAAPAAGVDANRSDYGGPLNSAATGGSQMSLNPNRLSRPIFMDNRLNPHAIMQHPNASRSSMSTLQDNQDYSRPLHIRNPDG
ncbi:MAG: hypothetical protein M1831_002144 [Alyxoria varia]|nr:MAG: hypothetical protein M1831_002144 [Alyxoria varia]